MRKSFRKPGKEGEGKSQGQHGLPGRDHQPVPGKPGPSAGSFWGLTPAPFSGLKGRLQQVGKAREYWEPAPTQPCLLSQPRSQPREASSSSRPSQLEWTRQPGASGDPGSD